MIYKLKLENLSIRPLTHPTSNFKRSSIPHITCTQNANQGPSDGNTDSDHTALPSVSINAFTVKEPVATRTCDMQLATIDGLNQVFFVLKVSLSSVRNVPGNSVSQKPTFICNGN